MQLLAPTQWFSRLRWPLVLVTGLLLATGWVAIARSEQLLDGSGQILRRQMLWSGTAMVALLAVTLPSYRVLCRWSYAALGAAIVLLALVYFFPPVKGASRWIRLAGYGFQPSEFAKVAFVLALARYLMYRDNYRRLRGLLLPLALMIAPMLLVLREPDLGTALIFPPVLVAMLFAAGARGRDLVALVLCGLALVPIMWTQMSRIQRARVTALFAQSGPDEMDPHPGPEGEGLRTKPSANGYHLRQAKQLMALGGIWGSAVTGDAVEDEGATRVPEQHTDSIFAVICERFGLWGAATTLGLYALLVWRCLVVAEATREPFGRLVAVGLAALVGVQALINTGMIVGLLPITGVSLPLISYGGSGLVANALAIGLVLNIGMRPGYEVGNEPFRFA